jgi:hypothetical protein
VKTTGERPHLQRGGLPGRGGSPSICLQTDLAIQLSSPHPSAVFATASEALCNRFQAPVLGTLEPGRNPFPGGYILQGRRINRSDPGRPAVPKRHFPEAGGGPSSRRSRRRFSQRSQHPVEKNPPPEKNTFRQPHPNRHSRTFGGTGKNALAPGVEGQPVSHSPWSQRPARLTGSLTQPTPESPHRIPGQMPSMLTLHVVGKAHFYLHVGSNVPGG